MRRVLNCTAIGLGLLASVNGQGLFDQINFRSAAVGGARLYGVSVFSGYSTSDYSGSNVNYGASFSAGWQRHGDKADFSILYSGIYGGLVQHSDFNSYDQSLSLGVSRQVARRWTASLSAAGQDSSLAQSIFAPSSLTVSSQLANDLNNLAALYGIGKFSTSQLASMIPGPSVLDSPVRSAILGDRTLTYSGQASLNYSYSPNLSFHLSGFSAGGQHRYGDHAVQPNYVMPRTIGVNAGVGMSYSRSPRTQIGLDFGVYRNQNRYQSSYATSATGSLGRKMGERWFLRIYGGATIPQFTRQVSGTPQKSQPVGGASLGIRTHAQSFVATYDRSASDFYGFATGTNTSLAGNWSWHRIGSDFSLFASFSQQHTRNTGFVSLSGWQASGGLSENLGSRATISAQYVYLSSAGTYVGNPTNISSNSVRVSLSWSPQSLPH